MELTRAPPCQLFLKAEPLGCSGFLYSQVENRYMNLIRNQRIEIARGVYEPDTRQVD
jgi:hypothetical protein